MHDNYEGWMTNTLLEEVTAEEARTRSVHVTTELFSMVAINGMKMNLPLGSSLPALQDGKGKMGKLEYSFAGKFEDRTKQKPGGPMIEALSHQWLNAPYCWGGRTIFGVDCSGFVQVNFKMMGIDIPRDAWQQAQDGNVVKKLKDAVTGDLAFFDDKEEIVHVGILLGNDRIIHASGKVRIDTIDKKGILHTETGRRTHRLQAIRRFW